MLNHPEQKENEVFIGNCNITVARPHLNELKTLRLGSVAYDIHGKTKNMGYMRPVFICRDEYPAYDRIMVQRGI